MSEMRVKTINEHLIIKKKNIKYKSIYKDILDLGG